MGRMRERHRPRVYRPVRDGHRDCLGVSGSQLPRRVATPAVDRRRRLMMADLATARRREREARGGAARDVAGEAGELFVAIVGEGVRSREPGAWNWSCPWRVGIALSLELQLGKQVH